MWIWPVAPAGRWQMMQMGRGTAAHQQVNFDRKRVQEGILCICSISLSPGTSYSFWELACR